MENITFGFQGGRKSRLNEPPDSYAKDFFYTYHLFNSNFNNVNIIEFKNSNSSIKKSLFGFLRYLTTIPFYCEQVLNKKNKDIIKKTNNLICVNQRVAFSLMPYTIFRSITGKINVSVFIMGLFLDQKRHFIRKILRHFFIYIFCFSNKNLIFLSKEELNFAKKKYSKFKHKFHFLPFSIDTDFWKSNKSFDKKDKIIFVGNDEKRDFEFLKNLPKNLPNLEFVLVSKFLTENDFKETNNTKVINGVWSDKILTDVELKNLYDTALMSLIPLKDSYQPSGQSVALQSMAMGVPVLITDTKGFWQKDCFSDSENIFFMEENSTKYWIERINYFIENKNILRNVSINAEKVVLENYNLEIFFNKLKKIISS